MRIYYEQQEYEPDKHKIIECWLKGTKPEDDSKSPIHTIPYNVLSIDEDFNTIAYDINTRGKLGRYYIDNSEQIWLSGDWIEEV